jgi:hypothetical protein
LQFGEPLFTQLVQAEQEEQRPLVSELGEDVPTGADGSEDVVIGMLLVAGHVTQGTPTVPNPHLVTDRDLVYIGDRKAGERLTTLPGSPVRSDATGVTPQ